MSHAVDMEQQEYAWHSKTVEEVERLQETDMQNGLTSAEAERRLEAYGKNELPGKPKVPFWVKLWGQLKNILIAILAVAAVVLAIVEEFTEVGLICAVVVINVTIGLVQEGKAEAAAEAIKGMLAGKAVVIRDGAAKTIAANEVVPGDICVVTAGDQVPADLRFFQAANIRCAEDALTGESNPVAKHVNPIEGEGRVGLGDRKNCAYSATNVQSGKGTGIVIATGDKAQIGQINAMVNEASEQKKMTNLEWQLEMFGRYVGVFTMVVAAVTFAVSLEVAGEDVGTAFKSAVSIAVAIIPEGLPAVVTISLALAMKYLAENNAIVKKLPAVETLGSVTVICSDKTGTLTKNEMTVQKVQTTSGQYPVKGVGYDPNLGTVCNPETGQPIEAKHMKQMLKMFEGIVLCNDATLKKAEMKSGNWIWQLDAGVPTEGAMCTLGLKMGCAGAGVDLDPEQILLYRKQKPRIAAVPFASEHKFMCCFHRYDEPDQKGIIMHVKGAPDRLLPRCKSQIIDDDLTKSEPIVTRFWEDKAAEMSAQGLRVLAVAIAPYDESKLTEEMTADVLLKAPAPFMTLIGLVAILDPPREDAIVACGKAKKAGITVKMITGDHPETAVAIAKQLGIVDPKIDSSKVVKIAGPELDKMLEEKGEAALDKFVMSCNVFARSSPANKISIVESLKRVGQTPSMTGDGVNDAPALAAADIGVAMGITGTDVSKEAAKMVLADDNFATIVVAVREGRRIWDNLVKILLYNMPVNFAQGLSVFFSYVLQMETVPLTAIQVLYVNMITSVTMGLMLAMEPAEPSIMHRPPRRRGKRLFGRMVAWHCIYVSALLIVCVLAVFQFQLDRVPSKGSACIAKGKWKDQDCVACTEATKLSNGEWPDEETCPLACRVGWTPDGRRSGLGSGLGIGGAGDESYWGDAGGDSLGQRRASKLPPQCDRVKKARAGAFNMLVFGEIAYALNCRYLEESSFTMKLFTENKWAWVAIGMTSILQVFFTYTPGVQDVFSNSNIDGIVWGYILGLMASIFVLIDIEKTYGPKLFMPWFRKRFGLCLPTPDDVGYMDEKEQDRYGDTWNLATSASITGIPSSRRTSMSREGSRDRFPSGTSHPVSGFGNRPEERIRIQRAMSSGSRSGSRAASRRNSRELSRV